MTARIVPNIATDDTARLAAFYRAVFQLEIAMEMGFIVTLTADGSQGLQLSFVSEGGSGTPVPALSIEVDDLDACVARARAAEAPIPYGPVTEPWGVRRFYLTDPDGTLVNVLTHAA